MTKDNETPNNTNAPPNTPDTGLGAPKSPEVLAPCVKSEESKDSPSESQS